MSWNELGNVPNDIIDHDPAIMLLSMFLDFVHGHIRISHHSHSAYFRWFEYVE
jgi:hypothetical protein